MKQERSGAKISKCGNYRWYLKRIWDRNKPIIMFVCLNPSTADHVEDDPTIRRIRGFAKSWGYGGFYVVNLFAYRSTDYMVVTQLSREEAIGHENDKWIKKISKRCQDVVFAWGVNGKGRQRNVEVEKMFPKANAIELSVKGYPKHPLYLKKNLKLIKYK